jgi:hypothetical protein
LVPWQTGVRIEADTAVISGPWINQRTQQIMNGLPGKQKGSAVFTLIVLAVLAYGVYIGIQYVPIMIESSSVDAVFDNLTTNQKSNPIRSVRDVEGKVNDLVNVNQLYSLQDSFEVRQYLGDIVVSVKYERELNLGFKTKLIEYEKSITLN